MCTPDSSGEHSKGHVDDTCNLDEQIKHCTQMQRVLCHIAHLEVDTSLDQLHGIPYFPSHFPRIEELKHALHCLHCEFLHLQLALLLVYVVVGGEHLVKERRPGGQYSLVAEEGLARALQYHVRVLRVDDKLAQLRGKKHRPSGFLTLLFLLVYFHRQIHLRF